MISLYLLFKLLHLLAVITWVGGAITGAVLNARVAASGDAAAARALSAQNEFLGRVLMGPSALATLLTGIGLVVVGRTGMPLWIVWGLVGVIGSTVVGGGILGRAGARLGVLMAAPEPDAAAIAALRRRMRTWGRVVMALLLSTVAVMVFKPTL
jgi:uncharacterized membrane protein